MTTGRINQITRCGAPRIPHYIYITGSDRGPRPPKGQSVKSGRGARSARPQRPSRRTGGDTDDHPIAPTKPLSASPHAVIQPRRPCGRGLAAAYGPRVEGPTPWTTLANSGSHGAAPSRNLSFRCGQRPSVHRLQRCRGPSGPRASGAAAAPHVHRDVDPGPVTRLRRHGRVPRDTPNSVWRAAAGKTPDRRRAPLQRTSFSGGGCQAQRA